MAASNHHVFTRAHGPNGSASKSSLVSRSTISSRELTPLSIVFAASASTKTPAGCPSAKKRHLSGVACVQPSKKVTFLMLLHARTTSPRRNPKPSLSIRRVPAYGAACRMIGSGNRNVRSSEAVNSGWKSCRIGSSSPSDRRTDTRKLSAQGFDLQHAQVFPRSCVPARMADKGSAIIDAATHKTAAFM